MKKADKVKRGQRVRVAGVGTSKMYTVVRDAGQWVIVKDPAMGVNLTVDKSRVSPETNEAAK